jgi:predicted Zn-dependent protease
LVHFLDNKRKKEKERLCPWPGGQLAWIYNQSGEFKNAENAGNKAVSIDNSCEHAWQELSFASERLHKETQYQKVDARLKELEA